MSAPASEASPRERGSRASDGSNSPRPPGPERAGHRLERSPPSCAVRYYPPVERLQSQV